MATAGAGSLIPYGDEIAALARRIEIAPDIPALAQLAPRLRELAMAVAEFETGTGTMNHLLSGLHDRC